MTIENDPAFAYKQGSFYEIFMHRAFTTTNRTKPGMHGSAMQNLIDVEHGNSIMIDFLGDFDKQLTQVKKYMHKGMDKYLINKKLPEDKIFILNLLKQRIDISSSSKELMNIVNKTLEATQLLLKH